MIEVTFINPDVSINESWEHGFLLRALPANSFHLVSIRSDGSWTHSYRQGTGEPDISLRQEVVDAIDKTSGGKNRLRLVAIGEQGWLFINGHQEGVLDLSKVGYDRIGVTLGLEFEGAVTSFRNFTLWKWHPSLAPLFAEEVASATDESPAPYIPVYGPTQGAIVHEIQKPDNFLEVFSGPQVDGDLMTEVTFHNPESGAQGAFNYGFLLRNAREGYYHWVYISGPRWFHVVQTGPDQYRNEARNRRSTDINIEPGGKNQMRLAIVGDDAWFFINGKYQTTLNLHSIKDHAPVGLMVEDVQEGKTTFEGFTVWRWHPSLQELPR